MSLMSELVSMTTQLCFSVWQLNFAIRLPCTAVSESHSALLHQRLAVLHVKIYIEKYRFLMN